MDIVDQAIADMREQRAKHSWPHKNEGSTSGANTLTGCIKSDGQKASSVYPCHNPIAGYKNAVVLWSAVTHRSSKEASQAYFNWLLKRSPWAKTGIVPKLDHDFMYNEGFVFTDLNKIPANLLHNFLIATRMTAEWGTLINDWFKLVCDYGVEPDFAFMFLTCYSTYKEKDFLLDADIHLAFKDKYDWPLDMARASEEYVLNFLTGNPVGVSKVMYYPTANTRPINLLWGLPLDTKDKNRYIQTLKDLYEEEFATKELIKTQLFSEDNKGIRKEVKYKPGALVEICKREQDRIYSILEDKKAA